MLKQQIMTKEQILGNYYREHKDTESAIYEAMDHYKDQEVAKEREKAKKLVEFAERLLHLHACEQEGLSSGKPSFADWMTATNNLQHEIDQYKQSLIEYGQPNSL